MSGLPAGVARGGIPFLVKDRVVVTNPDIIRRIAAHPDMARPAEVDFPKIFRTYFESTKFIHLPTNSYALPFQGDDRNERVNRRAVIEAQLSRGFSEEQIDRLVGLVRSNKSDLEVSMGCAKVVAQLILPLGEGEELPDDVAKAAFQTITTFTDIFNPIKYIRGRMARKKTEDYCASLLPDEEHLEDYVHNLGAAAQGFGQAILSMREMATDDSEKHFKDNPITNAVLRYPRRNTTLDGMFPEDNPLRVGESVAVLMISDAAKEAQDDLFLFGNGNEFRQCPFKGLFFNATADVHKQLQNHAHVKG